MGLIPYPMQKPHSLLKNYTGGPTPDFLEVPGRAHPRQSFVYNDTPYLVYRDPKHTIYRLIHRVKV